MEWNFCRRCASRGIGDDDDDDDGVGWMMMMMLCRDSFFQIDTLVWFGCV